MAMKMEDVAKMSLEDIAKHFTVQKCPICENPLVMYEKYRLDDKIVCVDCYYDAVDEEVSQYPIGLPQTNPSGVNYEKLSIKIQ